LSRRTLVFIGLIILFIVFLPGSLTALRAQQPAPTPDPSAQITSPVDNAPLFGTVSISGTAANPQFQSYRLDYLPVNDASAQWQPISRQITQQVREGILGQWDTTGVSDGAYQIRLRVILRNATVLEGYVRDVRVQNTTPTSLPTLPPPPSDTPPPTEGPSQTPLVQQPPSATPRPPINTAAVTATGVIPVTTRIAPTLPNLAPTNLPTVLESQPNVISGGAVWGAVCTGGIYAAIGFSIFGVISFIRSRFR
jgi:hypothetical protein